MVQSPWTGFVGDILLEANILIRLGFRGLHMNPDNANSIGPDIKKNGRMKEWTDSLFYDNIFFFLRTLFSICRICVTFPLQHHE